MSGRMESPCVTVPSEHLSHPECSLPEVAKRGKAKRIWVMTCEILLKNIQRVVFGDHDFKEVEFAYKCHFDTMLT